MIKDFTEREEMFDIMQFFLILVIPQATLPILSHPHTSYSIICLIYVFKQSHFLKSYMHLDRKLYSSL